MSDDLPMFPLGSVLFPGVYLPLHVFEPRYLALVQACLDGTPEFGVVLIERGSEVGGGDVRFDAACVARIVGAATLEGGRWAIRAVGKRRVRVVRWLADAPYPRAEVEEWSDPPVGPDAIETGAEVAAKLRRVLALSAELGEIGPDPATPLDDELVVASYQMAALAPVGPLDQLALLQADSVDERLELLGRMLDDEEAVLARRLAGG